MALEECCDLFITHEFTPVGLSQAAQNSRSLFGRGPICADVPCLDRKERIDGLLLRRLRPRGDPLDQRINDQRSCVHASVGHIQVSVAPYLGKLVSLVRNSSAVLTGFANYSEEQRLATAHVAAGKDGIDALPYLKVRKRKISSEGSS